MSHTQDTPIAEIYQPLTQAHHGLSGLIPLPEGRQALAARTALAGMAVKSIDAQYYLLHNDLTGKFFIGELMRAADRGVRIRLLVDDMASWGQTSMAAVLSFHPNMEIRIFNPFFRGGGRWAQMVYRFGTVTRRMHNKVFIADGQAVILGGRNIGNAYFEAHPAIEFGDLDVLAVGPVVDAVSASFDRYWNSNLAVPVERLARKLPVQDSLETVRKSMERAIARPKNTAYVQGLCQDPIVRSILEGTLCFYWGRAQVIQDPPEKILDPPERQTQDLVADRMATLFDEVRQELIIYSPYFVPGKKGADYLISLCQRGVRVRVLTNSLASTDVALVHAGYSRYRKRLLRGGVGLYELDRVISRRDRKAKKGKYAASKASLHTKSFVLDRRQVFIGSLNLDPRSFVENTEIGLLMDSPEIGRNMGKWFDSNVPAIAFKLGLRKNHGVRDQIRWVKTGKTHIRDPHASALKRLWVYLLRLLPVESQL